MLLKFLSALLNPSKHTQQFGKLCFTITSLRYITTEHVKVFVYVFKSSWIKPAGGVTVCRNGWSDVAAERAEKAIVNQVDQLIHQVDDVTMYDQLMTTPYCGYLHHHSHFASCTCIIYTEIMYYDRIMLSHVSVSVDLVKRQQMPFVLS